MDDLVRKFYEEKGLVTASPTEKIKAFKIEGISTDIIKFDKPI